MCHAVRIAVSTYDENMYFLTRVAILFSVYSIGKSLVISLHGSIHGLKSGEGDETRSQNRVYLTFSVECDCRFSL